MLESTLRFLERNYVWTRIENVDRTNELLLGENPEPPGFNERYFTRVQAYTAGYEREVGHIPHLSTALGRTIYLVRRALSLKPIYGEHPGRWDSVSARAAHTRSRAVDAVLVPSGGVARGAAGFAAHKPLSFDPLGGRGLAPG